MKYKGDFDKLSSVRNQMRHMKTILVDINSMQKTNDIFHLNENKRLSKSMVKNIINSGNFHNGHFVSSISTGKLGIDPKRFYSVTTNSTKLNFE
jgi:hypothetical protein